MEESKAKANDLKNEGNEYLKKGNFLEAVEAYTKAIELDPTNPIFFSNRAQSHIKMENYGLAINDCNEAIRLDSGFLKAYYRKGVSLMAILNFKEAQSNFKIVLKKAPNDDATHKNYKKCTDLLKRQAFEKAIAADSKESIIDSTDYENILIEKSWNGPDLEITSKKEQDKDVEVQIEGLDISYLKFMIKTFKEGGWLPKKHVHAIIAKVREILKKESTLVEISLPHSKLSSLNPNNVVLEGGKMITVAGDTHGQFFDVLNLFQKFGFVSEDHIYLFNGDFVDRGSWSCEVALYLYVLKILYPKSLYINRGNHETNDMNKAYGFADECEHKYSRKIYEAFSESFGALPYATLINDSYLCLHGGLFSDDNVSLDDVRRINRFPLSGSTQPPKDGVALELLWTDPQPENGRSPSKRGIGLQFGPDITEKFCVKNKVRKVIRSHEVRMDGAEEEHNGRLITVFSAPNYCDSTGNLGAVINITENPQYDKESDDGEGYKLVDEPNCPWLLDIKKFEAVPHPDIKPMAYAKLAF